jgi:hypothetical protein
VVNELWRIGVTVLLGLILGRMEKYLDRFRAMEMDIVRLKEHAGIE